MKSIKAKYDRTKFSVGQQVVIIPDVDEYSKPYGVIESLELRRKVHRVIVRRIGDNTGPAKSSGYRRKAVTILTGDRIAPMTASKQELRHRKAEFNRYRQRMMEMRAKRGPGYTGRTWKHVKPLERESFIMV